jgi:PhzF family phenazine biosynthesis protein
VNAKEAPTVTHIDIVSVFAGGPGGGNAVPIVTDSQDLSDHELRGIAAEHGLEIGVVTSPAAGSASDIAMRYWVPTHEMSMCGHATIGALWLLFRSRALSGSAVTIDTAAGLVRARAGAPTDPDAVIEISQPPGAVVPITGRAQIESLAHVLNIDVELMEFRSVVNAATTRVKTLVPLPSEDILDGLRPRFDLVEAWCTANGSTGLYPYAPVDGDDRTFAARQFPRSSGYPEDPATGIAAAALAFGLARRGLVDPLGAAIGVQQGSAMGRPSEITVRFEPDDPLIGCWVGGTVRPGR